MQEKQTKADAETQAVTLSALIARAQSPLKKVASGSDADDDGYGLEEAEDRVTQLEAESKAFTEGEVAANRRAALLENQALIVAVGDAIDSLQDRIDDIKESRERRLLTGTGKVSKETSRQMPASIGKKRGAAPPPPQ